MASPTESNSRPLPDKDEAANSSSKPVTPTTASSSVPTSDTDNDNNVHVIPTISVDRSKSFDSFDSNRKKGSGHTANKIFDTTHMVRVSPGSNEQNIGRSFSFSDKSQSVISGELVLSDSNDTNLGETYVGTGGESQTQPQPQPPPPPPQALPKMNTTDAYDNNEADPDRSGAMSPASSCDSEISSSEEVSVEDDTEVLLAKEMALAIAKNPTMTPTQLRELQQIIQHNMERKQESKKRQKAKEKSSKKFSKKMKEAIKETKRSAKASLVETKAALKETKQSAREGAKKGLRAAGIIRKSSIVSSSEDLVSGSGAGTGGMGTVSTHLRQLEDDGERIRISGTIWKRRSGLGKYSMTAPWERRRVVLKGTKLIYYKTLQETQSGDATAEEEDSHSEYDHYQHHAALAQGAGSNPGEGWINTIIDKTGVTIPWESSGAGAIGGLGGQSSHSINGARGYLDLHKEQASAGASYGHTGAPTPFALSIKVASTTKYKFCFDSQQELMQWLAAITDVVVGGSVDAYNAEILEANDPSSHGIAEAIASDVAAAREAWEGNSPRAAANSKREAEGGGRQLWSTEGYTVSSDDRFATGSNHLGSSKSTFAGDDDSSQLLEEQPIGASPQDYTIDSSQGDSVLAVPLHYAKPLFVVMNAILLGARSDHGYSDDWFWHVLVFFNVFLVMTVDAAKLGGAVALNRELVGASNKRTATIRARPKQQSGQSQFADLPTINSGDDTADSEDDTAALPKDHFVPPAGSSAIRIDDPSEVPTKDGIIFAGWREVPASGLMVRGCGYKANKTKVPCPESLYQCVELDIFESKKRVPDMAGRVVLPATNFDDDGPKTWNAPDVFVITVALPTDPPKLYGGSTDNGGGYTITMYCVMRPEVRAILRRVTADGYNPTEDKNSGGDPNTNMVNAVRLFDEWCRRAPSDDNWMARFKVVPQGNNLAEIGLPAWISNYNGKPFLIKRPGTTGFLYRHPDKSCMEFDVSLHPFPYLAKQGICYMKDGFFNKILATLAFCIEGRTDDELPECLIGLFQLCYPDPMHAIQAEELFAGKSHRSK